MKRILSFLSAVVVLFAVIACKETKKPDGNADQMNQVMAIHDEVLPKMSAFGKLVKELKSKEDSTAMGLEYKKAREDLQAAHNNMMDWMKGFGDRFDSDEILNGKALSEEKQAWLDEEEQKIKEVRQDINSSIEKAEALLSPN